MPFSRQCLFRELTDILRGAKVVAVYSPSRRTLPLAGTARHFLVSLTCRVWAANASSTAACPDMYLPSTARVASASTTFCSPKSSIRRTCPRVLTDLNTFRSRGTELYALTHPSTLSFFPLNYLDTTPTDFSHYHFGQPPSFIVPVLMSPSIVDRPGFPLACDMPQMNSAVNLPYLGNLYLGLRSHKTHPRDPMCPVNTCSSVFRILNKSLPAFLTGTGLKRIEYC